MNAILTAERAAPVRASMEPGVSLLAIYAAANLALGLALIIAQPARADDIWIMYEWCRAWLLHGQQLYAGVDARTDYPPNAIVLLSPLAFVPREWVVWTWTMVSVVLTPLAAVLVVRATSPRGRALSATVPVLLFLCWGGARTFLEFSRISFTLGFVAVVLADSRPAMGGVALGLALAKPHIAGPILLWGLCTRRARMAGVALAVVAVGFAAYCLRAHVAPATVLIDYAHVLLALYSGPDPLLGRTSLLTWWLGMSGNVPTANVLWVVTAGLLLVVPTVLAIRGARSPERTAGALALFFLWSLLTIYHLSSNVVVLLLPAFVFLLQQWRRGDPALMRWSMAAVVLIQAAMMLDVPVHLMQWAPDAGPGLMLVRDFDRIVVLVTFAAVTVVSWRQHPAAGVVK